MRTQEIKIGTIDEWLKEDVEVANKIVEKYSDINTDYGWYTYNIENFCNEAENLGFEIDPDDVQFSGFWSQGDGASFEGNVDLLTYLKKTKQLTVYRPLVRAINCGYIENHVSISRNSHQYSHENTCGVDCIDIYEDITPLVEKMVDNLENEIEETRLELCSKLYSGLEAEFDSLSSRDVIIETLSANEYDFDIDGNIVA